MCHNSIQYTYRYTPYVHLYYMLITEVYIYIRYQELYIHRSKVRLPRSIYSTYILKFPNILIDVYICILELKIYGFIIIPKCIYVVPH